MFLFLQPCSALILHSYDRRAPHFDGANFFHFLAGLDAHHPAVPRVLARLQLAAIPVGILESFVRLSCAPEQYLQYPEMAEDELHTPLTYAVLTANCPVVEWLLSQGANPDCHYVAPNSGLEPYAGFEPCSGFDPIPSSSSWPIMSAATFKDTSMLMLLLERGANVHVSRDPSCSRLGVGEPEVYVSVTGKLTPLHLAAYHRRYDGVQLLILHGADFRGECDLVDPNHRGFYFIGFAATGTARDATVLGIKSEHLAKRRSEEDRLLENAVTDALEEYDAAVQAGLRERRLFVLCCLQKLGSLKSLPEHVVANIFNLASLYCL